MARKNTPTKSGPAQRRAVGQQRTAEESVPLSLLLSTAPAYKAFDFWIVGETPLITHAWSEKAKRQMLEKQGKATRGGREARDPKADFLASLYEMGDGSYGFPAMAVKNALVAGAHKDKGVTQTSAKAAIWLNAQMVRTRPALAGAICDMPLLKIFGSRPEMREDPVKIGKGLSKTATLAYRAQFTVWALNVRGRFNASMLSPENLVFLFHESGMVGLGEWRNEKSGMFGSYHLASPDEMAAWKAFAAGKGPLPIPAEYQEAAE